MNKSSDSPYLLSSESKYTKMDNFTLKAKKNQQKLPELKENEEKSFVLLTASLSL